MGAFFVYILKTACSLALFYLFYRLLLSRETFHRFNRFALLGILLFSGVLPLTQIHVEQPSEVQQTMISLQQLILLMETSPIPSTASTIGETPEISWPSLLLWVYLLGVALYLILHGLSWYRMLTLIHQGRCTNMPTYIQSNTRAILKVHEKEIAPFSWMHYIVISQKDLKENGREILIHELAHIVNRHSWDLLIADLCILLQWFNPAAWLLKQELQNIHEYEADETVIHQGIDAKQYQLLIIKKAVGTRLYSMANSFNHSKLKKRITMMWKEKSSPWARLKYLYVLPAAAGTAMVFASPKVSHVTEELSAAKVNEIPAIVETKVQEITENRQPATAVMQPASPIKVTGIVLDARDNKPLIGCVVKLKNSNKGTVTDKEGHFSLEIPNKDAVIVFSYVGYQSIEIKEAYGRKEFTIKMEKAPQELDEVLVVSYDKETPSTNGTINAVRVNEPATVVDEAPQYPGGTAALKMFLTQNLKYPEDARESHTEGNVIVRFTVGEDGKICNEKVIRSISPSIDAEALRIVRLMPAWTPAQKDGKAISALFTLPVTFRLHKKQESNKEPLILINGKEVGNDILHAINPDKIDNIKVVKDEETIREYGEKAKNGIIFITLKKREEDPQNSIRIK